LLLLLVLWLVKHLLWRKLVPATVLMFWLFGAVGAYFTYLDFTTTSHRMMKENFHAGGYLFWAAWMLTCLYFLFVSRQKKQPASIPNTEQKPSDNPPIADHEDGSQPQPTG